MARRGKKDGKAAAGKAGAEDVRSVRRKPGQAGPGGVAPGKAGPGGVKPGGAKPGGVKPGGAKPGGVKPGAAKPGGAKPGGAKPGGKRPGSRRPGKAGDGPDLGPRPPKAGKLRAAPLMLLPLRLEYRVVRKGEKLRVVAPPKDVAGLARLRAQLAEAGAGDPAAAEMRARLTAMQEGAGGGTPEIVDLPPPERDEIWLRWYPDDNFAESGQAPVTEEEKRQLDALTSLREFKGLPDPGVPEQMASWEALAALCGPARALHLLRGGGAPQAGWEARIGRIACLPERVAVFAATGRRLLPLGEGAAIPPNPAGGAGPVSFAASGLGGASWVTSFDLAVAEGMGMRLADPEAVAAALAAEWLVAVGTRAGDGRTDLGALIADAVAGGGFGFLPEDTATNNAPGAALDILPDREAAAGFLASARGREDGAFQVADLPAHRLADMLGLARGEVEKAPHGAHASGQDFAAMLRVIGPALLDGAAAATTVFDEVSDSDLIEAMAGAVTAGGPLSALRFGDGAYGVLPLAPTDTGEAADTGSDAGDALAALAVSFGQLLEQPLAELSQDRSLRIEPEDPDAAEKLGLILTANRVSRRLDVGLAGEDEVAPVGCPHVAGGAAEYQPGAYLQRLLDEPLADLPDPAEGNRLWPLLYRLARLSLTQMRVVEPARGMGALPKTGGLRRVQGAGWGGLPPAARDAADAAGRLSVRAMSAVLPERLDRVPRGLAAGLIATNQRFEEAIRRLSGIAGGDGGTARLEALMMEVVDVLQHRIDAWLTGHAWLRLQRDRAGAAAEGLRAGYYGFQRGPGQEGAASTAGPGGYLQAPSQPQAVAAAVLRSAHLRNAGEGAFALNLRSGRATRALRLMDHLRKGVSLPQALGLRAEAWLRRSGNARLIAGLRADFPVTDANAADRAPAERGIDGLAFVQGSGGAGEPALRALQGQLADDLDALADLVMAEAVYQRAGGAADVANGWLQVLSGGAVPGRPEFLRSERLGQASDHRVSLVLPGPDPRAREGFARATAEPGAAALAAELDRDFAASEARVIARAPGAAAPVWSGRFRLAGDLGMHPLDLAYEGAEGLARRLKCAGLAEMIGTDGVMEALAGSGGAAALRWEMLLDGAEIAQSARLALLGGLAAMLRASRPLAPGDLNAAAAPEAVLDAAAERQALMPALKDLGRRLAHLSRQLDRDTKALIRLRGQILDRVTRVYVKPGRAWGEDPAEDARMRHGFRTYAREVLRAAGWGEAMPGGPPVPAEAVADLAAAEAGMVALEDRLGARRTALDAYLAGRRVPGANAPLEALRALRDADAGALAAALGMPACPVFPRYGLAAATRPLTGGAEALAAGLGDWPRYRRKLARARDLLGLLTGYRAHPVSAAATADDAGDPEADRRPETEAPRTYHRGRFLCPQERLAGADIAGVIIDEWVEKRPSDTQATAIAVNYDTPQAEAPNCLLLCAAGPDPEGAGARFGWTPEAAAARVVQAIDRMRLRAFTTQNTPFVDTILPDANQVPFRRTGDTDAARVPKAPLAVRRQDWFRLGTGLDPRAAPADPGAYGAGWNQTGGFTRSGRRK